MVRKKRPATGRLDGHVGGAGDSAEFPLRAEPAPAPPSRDVLTRPFLICLVVGGLLALLGQVHGFETVGVVGPILLTLAYPVWGYSQGITRRASLRERFADNAYYLGFIFTQLALFVGFVPPALMSRAITSTDVLRAFGVAIGASMVGLVARTMIVQTGHTTSENADIVEQEVENVAREVETLARGVSAQTRVLMDELAAVSQSLVFARKALEGELGAWVSETAATLKSYDERLKLETEVIAAGASAAGHAAETAAAGIEVEQSLLVDQIRRAAEGLTHLQGDMRAQVAAALESVTSTARTFAASAALADEAQRTMRDGMAGASENLVAMTDALRGAQSAFGQVPALTEGVATLDGRMVAIGNSLGNLSETVGETTRAVTEIGAQAAVSAATLADGARNQAAQRIEAFDGQMKSAVVALEAVLTNFRNELQQLRV